MKYIHLKIAYWFKKKQYFEEIYHLIKNTSENECGLNFAYLSQHSRKNTVFSSTLSLILCAVFLWLCSCHELRVAFLLTHLSEAETLTNIEIEQELVNVNFAHSSQKRT